MLGDLTEARVLDLYAGSGALGIEALSRGAAHAVFVERNRAALIAIEKNLRALELSARATVLPFAVERSLGRLGKLGPFDLVLVDPPYADVPAGVVARTLSSLLAEGLARPDGRLLLEHARRDSAPALLGARLDRTRRHGETNVSLYDVVGASSPVDEGEHSDAGEPSRDAQ